MGLKPFRFGVVVWQRSTRDEWVELARKMEAWGYSTLLVPDHFSDQLAPAPALLLAAEATSTLRVGSQVYDNDFRHPALLAKEAATLDRLTGGRFEFGIGAGWLKSEYDQVGISFDAPGTRVGRLEEAVQVIKRAWAEGPFDFSGQHYTISGYDGLPKPLTQPGPPLFIGGAGRRLLTLAGREADIVGITPRALREGGLDARDVTEAGVEQKIAWVREAAGERMESIELTTLVYEISITDDRAGRIEQLLDEWDLSREEIATSPYMFIGSVDEIVEQLQARRERLGISYITLFEPNAERFAPVVAHLAGA